MYLTQSYESAFYCLKLIRAFWQVGPVVKLCMGIEPAFYVDSGPPTFCFNPCGHMASEKTVR